MKTEENGKYLNCVCVCARARAFFCVCVFFLCFFVCVCVCDNISAFLKHVFSCSEEEFA
jgi:Na+/melibiose symporter-like transporter